jgi:NAD(P)-dependent dehydrogenase (short-subunit alcohol dehydrogenase family)
MPLFYVIVSSGHEKDNTGQTHYKRCIGNGRKVSSIFKEARHPHTNMAKAALNMLTHTAAGELVRQEYL